MTYGDRYGEELLERTRRFVKQHAALAERLRERGLGSIAPTEMLLYQPLACRTGELKLDGYRAIAFKRERSRRSRKRV